MGVMACVFLLPLISLALTSCGKPTEPPPPPSAQSAPAKISAKDLFDQTVKLHHLPSAEKQGAERDRLLDQAAAGYEQLLKDCPAETHWCAQALRSLGNVRAEQRRLDDAVKAYTRVGEECPREEWEVVQAWKSAADLLWEAGRRDEATGFYRKIVERFDVESASPIVKTVVKGSKNRLADGASR